MNNQEIEQKIKDMLERNNIKIVHISLFEKLMNWYVLPLFKKVKYFFQEHVNGYNETDPWNMAWYIARKALPPLKHMRNNFHGTSIRYHKDEKDGKDGTVVELNNVVPGPDSESLTEQEWRDVLDDIIFAFEYQLKKDDLDYYNKKDMQRQKRGLKLFSIYYNNLWD